MSTSDPPSKPVRVVKSVPAVAAAVAMLLMAVFFLSRMPEELRKAGAEANAAADAGPAASATEVKARCVAAAAPPFRVGPAGTASSDAVPGTAPFAVEVGRGAQNEGEFALGVKRDKDGSTVAEVVLVGPKGGKLVTLGRSRGDVDPPVVVKAGEGFVAGVLEPNAAAYALRLVRLQESGLLWGAELPQGQDESLAFDLAFGERLGLAVWDEVSPRAHRGQVMLATLATKDLKLVGVARRVSGRKIDAELPRVVVREGGFWLAYVARQAVELPDKPDDEALRRDEKGGRYAAEMIAPSWIELVLLDADGQSQSTPRAITPRDGHVLGFDMQLSKEGAVLLAWRDDDTPTGSQGGRVSMAVVDPSGAVQQLMVADENVGAGIPILLPGWVALTDRRDRLQLAPLSDKGEIRGALRTEEALGHGQVVAAHGDDVLLAKPLGTVVELSVVRCKNGDERPDAGQ